MNQLFDNAQNMLKDISKTNNFVNPQIKCNDKLGAGHGFMGDVYYVEITETNGNKKLDLVAKQATTSEYARKHFSLSIAYHNEKVFYENVWSEFLRFQKANLGSVLLDNIPIFYAADCENGKECLIVENLKSQNYQNLNLNHFYDHELAELLLKKYGQFHGLSFAYKSKMLKKFSELSKLYIPLWEEFVKGALFCHGIEKGIINCLSYLHPIKEAKIIEKLEKYVKFRSSFVQSLMYNGEHAVILLGDCWSNNVLLKYLDSGKIDNIKLIDFQQWHLGSIVNDLSYSLYGGGTQEIYKNFDRYLKIYHDSLRDTCSKFGCTNFISFEELKKEWKEYCKFGFLMAQQLIRIKLSKATSIDEMKSELDDKETFDDVSANEEEIKRRSLDLLYHMYENDFL